MITNCSKYDITKHDEYVFEMKLLDPEKSWELFLKKAFINNTNDTCPEELESIGRQILGKCDGLPLAISVVGGLLVVVPQDKRRWQEVLDQIDSNIPENTIPNILGLSHHNLCPQLKSCFLCLAFFKEDFTIPSNELVSIWHAQGLIQEKGSRSIEDIGRGYLNELINRSMLQIQDLTIDGQVKIFRLHDLLRDVCLIKVEEEMGVKIVKGEEEGCLSESSYKPRHHVVYNKSSETFSLNPLEFSDVAMKMESLRDFGTYRVYGRAMKVEKWKCIESLKGIRLVDLVEMSSRLVPNSHLRELGIFVCMIKDMDGMILHGGFPCLKALSLKAINLKGIDIEEGGMSCLKQLRICNCSELESTKNLPRHIIISYA
ncbi:hypothetical protein SASPL_130887 [Salvia splendens]|uniref:Disease resistance protein winged helix domain-containing protein n=1 Tax=Salvia splendens TaxID=180675 RepID=A0A4D8Y4L2_SALSN|nr:hypothetical protein SASPL_156790 [Salvia splendens]KAG6407887.1 hypothetical protein SASPL_130887 [Salvia splendens]